jgi:hypothetical protein
MNKSITEQLRVVSDNGKQMKALSRNQFKERVDCAARLVREDDFASTCQE